MSTPAAVLAEIERQADLAYEANPGGTPEPAVIEQMRRILPAPQAEQQAA